MENFDWTSFTRKISVKSDLKTMYSAWAKAGELNKWFLEESSYSDAGNEISVDSNAKEGYTYAWNWYLYDVIERGTVIKANGVDHFGFTFAGDCHVNIKLEEVEGEVLVTLNHSGIPTDDKSKKNIRLGCDSGWSFYLVNLKSVYENGYDLRNKNPNLKGMINN